MYIYRFQQNCKDRLLSQTSFGLVGKITSVHQECRRMYVDIVSSVRSSSSHPDLLLTHRFFRPHRSSALDLHFLSHYSYIKAIKLYKGNHWTRCARFMVASWVRLGITNVTWGHLGHYLGITWGLLGDDLGSTLAKLGKTLTYSGTLWHTLAYSGILCHTLSYSVIL